MLVTKQSGAYNVVCLGLFICGKGEPAFVSTIMGARHAMQLQPETKSALSTVALLRAGTNPAKSFAANFCPFFSRFPSR